MAYTDFQTSEPRLSSGKWGGSRKGSGRKVGKSGKAKEALSIRLSAEDIEYLELWSPNKALALEILIARARLFWPCGL